LSTGLVDRRLLPGTVASVGDLVEPVLEQAAVGVHGHVADACPSICWTTFTSAPAAIARLAAVCRRSCG
jgi:hypothetical protein